MLQIVLQSVLINIIVSKQPDCLICQIHRHIARGKKYHRGWNMSTCCSQMISESLKEE